MPPAIPALMYHRILANPNELLQYDPGERPYILDLPTFRKQLALLDECGCRGCCLGDIERDGIQPGDVLLSFDDGAASDAEIVLPILEKYGYRADFFVTTSWIGLDGFMSPLQLKQLAAAGMGVGSHGVTHRFLNDLPADEVRMELEDSRQKLETILDEPICSISFPGGRSPKSISPVWSAGYRWAGTSKVGLFCEGSGGLFPRVAIRRNTSMKDYQHIVCGESFYFCKEKVRAFLLNSVKRMVGNAVYVGLRKKLMGGCVND